MDNLSFHRKNNIYKIYSKLNDSNRRYKIERDGQKNNINTAAYVKNVEPQSIDIEPYIKNKPCNQPIVGIYKKKWYGAIHKKLYHRKRCKVIKFIKFYNSKEIIESYQKREQRLKDRKSREPEIFKRLKERKKLILQKEKEQNIEKALKRTEKQNEKKKEEIRLLIDLLNYKEKYEAIKNKNWVGTTSRGSKFHFLGVESVDLVDLKNKYRVALDYGYKMQQTITDKKSKENIEDKLHNEQKIIKQQIFEKVIFERKIKEHLRKEEVIRIKKDKHYENLFQDFKEKLQAIKEKRWIGTTSTGSSFWFLGVEEVDLKDLKKQYAEVLKYQEEKKIKKLQEKIDRLKKSDGNDFKYYETIIKD